MTQPFIVAEMSANHLGTRTRAREIIDAAADAGADAVKFQTWKPGTMCLSPTFRLQSGPWAGRLLRDLYEEAHTPWEWHHELFERVRQCGMVPFSAAFDRESVDFLERLGVDRHKVASFELVDLPLIRYMASKGKPMILSTGMATWEEICDAWSAIHWPRNMTVLKCTSAYPASPSDANLAAFQFTAGWGQSAGWGLSDHTIGIGVACAAAALGAIYVEKHLTLSRADGGPDAGFSMEPHEFAQMVTECRHAAAAVGESKFGPTPGENTMLRRSLWAVHDIHEGEPLELEVNVRTARPALGLPCSFDLANRRASRFIAAGTPLNEELLQ